MNRDNNKKASDICWIFLPIIIAFSLQTFLEMVGIQALVVYILSYFNGSTFNDLLSDITQLVIFGPFYDVIQLVYSTLIVVLFGYLYKKWYMKDKEFRFFKSSCAPGTTIGGMVLFTISIQYVCVYLMASLASAFPSWLEVYNTLLDTAGINDSMSVMTALYAILLGPVCEELIFRGLTLKAGLKLGNVPLALILQAVLFGAYHRNMLQGCYAAVFGLGLGYVMYLYDDLSITIILHMAFNVLGTYGSSYMPFGGDTVGTFFIWILGSLVICYGSLILLKKGSAKVNKPIESSDI